MSVTSTNPQAHHALLRDVFKLPHVNDGGYIIFGLPPTEMSVHHGDSNNNRQLFLTCSSVDDQGRGLVTEMTLPGGGKLNVYQPRHARPKH